MAGMMAKLASHLSKRDENDHNNGIASFDSSDNNNTDGSYEDYDGYDGYDDYGWWWSPTGMAVRYTILSVIFVAILLYFVGGYLHARRRVRKGLAPMSYHAWMVRRYYPQPQQDHYYHHQTQYPPQAYAMPSYAQPPPAYNPYTAPPPAYQPPEGASKVMADQNFPRTHTHRAEGYAEGSQNVPAPTTGGVRQ